MTRTKKYPEAKGREIVYNRAQGRCEMCGSGNGTDWSHRVARSQLGGWEPSNGMLACRRCHAWCHANPAEAREKGWILKSTRNPLEEPALLATLFGPRWGVLDDQGGITFQIEGAPC